MPAEGPGILDATPLVERDSAQLKTASGLTVQAAFHRSQLHHWQKISDSREGSETFSARNVNACSKGVFAPGISASKHCWHRTAGTWHKALRDSTGLYDARGVTPVALLQERVLTAQTVRTFLQPRTVTVTATTEVGQPLGRRYLKLSFKLTIQAEAVQGSCQQPGSVGRSSPEVSTSLGQCIVS